MIMFDPRKINRNINNINDLIFQPFFIFKFSHTFAKNKFHAHQQRIVALSSHSIFVSICSTQWSWHVFHTQELAWGHDRCWKWGPHLNCYVKYSWSVFFPYKKSEKLLHDLTNLCLLCLAQLVYQSWRYQ